MLPADDLTLAIDIQSRSYRLLRWVADAVGKGFIPATRAHEYADVADSAMDWIEQHYQNFPPDMRPDRRHLRQFANFFSTYVTTSFQILDNPGSRMVSECGCYCPLCTYFIHAPHLRARKVSTQDKRRARRLMADRVFELAQEEGLEYDAETATAIVEDNDSRRSAGYSAYGKWLIRRIQGDTEGTAILALWRQIAWLPEGSPQKNFELHYNDFVDAEESLIGVIRTARQ